VSGFVSRRLFSALPLTGHVMNGDPDEHRPIRLLLHSLAELWSCPLRSNDGAGGFWIFAVRLQSYGCLIGET